MEQGELHSTLEEAVLEAIHQFEIRYGCLAKLAKAEYRNGGVERVVLAFDCSIEL